jgi:hypothetical protein
MVKEELYEIVQYIVRQGVQAIQANMGEQDAIIDYLAIFAKDEEEYGAIERILESTGVEIDKETTRTGRTFLLNEPIETPAGLLTAVKIRKPDATRPQRGAPDFKIRNYQALKEKFLQTSGNVTLMARKDYEMIEIKGVDVLVYIPSKTVHERIKGHI